MAEDTKAKKKTYMIGAAGGNALRDLLSKSKDLTSTFVQFQNENGLLSSLPNASPALKLLDALGLSRSDVYRQCLEHTTRYLLMQIEDRLEQSALQPLLMKTFPFIEFPELRKIPIAILSKQKNTPVAFLRKLTENREIMNQLPFHVKQRIWMVDATELRLCVSDVITSSFLETQSIPSVGWDTHCKSSYSTNRRTYQDSCVTLTRMSKDNVELFRRILVALRENITSISPPDNIPMLGMLRSDFVSMNRSMSHNAALTSVLRNDPIHRLELTLDACRKVGYVSQEKLVEILTVIHQFFIDKVAGDENSSNNNESLMELPKKKEEKPVVVEAPVLEAPEPKEPHKNVPSQQGLVGLIGKLGAVDSHGIFAEPVPEGTEGYFEMIKHPMDLSTMRSKAAAGHYSTMESFIADFDTMISNCAMFNPPNTIFAKEGKKLGKKGKDLIKKATPQLLGLPAASGRKRKPSSKLVQSKMSKKFAAEAAEAPVPALPSIPIPPSVSPVDTGIAPTGHYKSELIDIALLLSNPFVYQILIKSLFNCVCDCIRRGQMPLEHSMIQGLMQLLELGEARHVFKLQQIHDDNNSSTAKSDVKPLILSAPDAVTIRAFLPLLTRTIIRYDEQFSDIANDVSQDEPMTDKAWNTLLSYSIVHRKIARWYLAQNIALSNVNVYKNILDFFTRDMEEEMIQDPVFIQSVVTSLLFHRGDLSVHMRAITMDEFLLPKLKEASSGGARKVFVSGDNELKIPYYKIHLQFARLLAETSSFSACSISPPDLQQYAQEALTGLTSDHEELVCVWNHRGFKAIRECYEKFFIKFPGARSALRLPVSNDNNTTNNSTPSPQPTEK